MGNRLLDETTIREYLLGRLNDNPDLAEQIDEQSLTDAEFSETADVIEDEIIEEYLEGALNAGDTLAVKKHFLRPPERQRKLRNARLLRLHLSNASSRSESASIHSVRKFPEFLTAFRAFAGFRTIAEVAAVVLLIVSTAYLIRLQRQFQTEVRESGQKLAQESQRTVALNHQLEAALTLAHPPTAMLSLLQPGIRRGETQIPELVVGVGTKTIHVEIALPSETPGLYSVRLENAAKELWSRDKLEAFTSPDGAVLMFDLPSEILTQGVWEFVVRQSSGLETSYFFRVSRL